MTAPNSAPAVRNYSVAVAQTAVHGLNDRQPVRERMAENASGIAAQIDALCLMADDAPRIIVFPALALSGMGIALRQGGLPLSAYPGYPAAAALDLIGGDDLLAPIIAACARHDCYMASSCVEKIAGLPGHSFHSAFIIGPSGVVLRSPKIQAHTVQGVSLLETCLDEYVAAVGMEAVLPVVETPIGRLACLVHWEFLVPEIVRALALKGAQVILHPTGQRSGPEESPNTAIKQALAYSNSVYWVSAAMARDVADNRAGRIEATLAGGSTIVGPDGALLASFEGIDEVLGFARVDLDHLEAVRKREGEKTKPAGILYTRILPGLL